MCVCVCVCVYEIEREREREREEGVAFKLILWCQTVFLTKSKLVVYFMILYTHFLYNGVFRYALRLKGLS